MTAPTAARRRRTDVPSPRPDWAYFVDLDGTLLDLSAVPSDVHVDQALRNTVTALTRVAGGAVALITGRSIAEVDRLFPRLRLAVAGQHGLERRDASGRTLQAPELDASLAAPRNAMRAMVARHPGLLFEDKGLSLALHYRQAPALASYAHRVMHAWQSTLGATYCVQRGKRVVELKPAGHDKGAAIRAFMHEAPYHGRRPVFIGDDVTDECGFDVINELGGISVKVGAGRTTALWTMPDVTAVRCWLSLAVSAALPPTP